MKAVPHATLRTLLFAISALEGIAGLVLFFAPRWLLAMAPSTLVLPGIAFVQALLMGLGIICFALGYLACVAARDPVRQVAVIDALIFLCFAAVSLDVYALAVLHVGVYFPGPYLIVRGIVQFAIGIALVGLRPRGIEAPG